MPGGLFGVSVTADPSRRAGLQRYQTESLSDDAAFLSWDRIAQRVREQGIEGD
ncbi:MAG: hypothetical protein ACE5K9_09510 [Candidatus Methylomirabilales bacterium]